MSKKITEEEFKQRVRKHQANTGMKYRQSQESLATLWGFRDHGQLRRYAKHHWGWRT